MYFSETCLDYLERWTAQFHHVESFQWAGLKKELTWNQVEETAEFLIQRNVLNRDDVDRGLFDQYGYLKEFVTTSKIQSWNSAKASSEDRWVECFRHFEQNNIPVDIISNIAEYILCLPGTSASVERVFSLVNKIWTSDKTRLELPTLKNILFVKYNIKKTCIEFYNFLMGAPNLLVKIAGQDKYDFKDKDKIEKAVNIEAANIDDIVDNESEEF